MLKASRATSKRSLRDMDASSVRTQKSCEKVMYLLTKMLEKKGRDPDA
jgi:hypothetical protein